MSVRWICRCFHGHNVPHLVAIKETYQMAHKKLIYLSHIESFSKGTQIEKLRPFPEVPEALARLHTRYKLAVLSNGDPDMLEAARPYHGIAFDDVISVAMAGSFKPHVATYTKAAELLGVRRN